MICKKKLHDLPDGFFEILGRYGDPFLDEDTGEPDPNFLREHMIKARSPFPLRLSWEPTVATDWIYGHKDVVPVVVDALKELVHKFGIEYIQKNEWDFYGGMYNHRRKRGNNQWSTHCWGIAIDYAPNLGPYGSSAQDYPDSIAGVFLSRGFLQLENDPMHFQACTGY